MNTLEWSGVVACILTACAVVGYIDYNMEQADRFAKCEVNGTLTVSASGKLECMEGAEHGR